MFTRFPKQFTRFPKASSIKLCGAVGLHPFDLKWLRHFFRGGRGRDERGLMWPVAVWAVTVCVWAVAASMWAATDSMWAVTASRNDAHVLCGLS